MATYSTQSLAQANNTFLLASTAVSAVLLYPSVSGNNANVSLDYNPPDLLLPVTSGSSAVNITTTWGDVVKVLVYNNGSQAAVATAGVSGTYTTGSLSGITVSTQGFGYVVAPVVTISAPQSGTNRATAVANLNTATGAVTGITITSPGSGYASATVTVAQPASPWITFAITSLSNRQSNIVTLYFNTSKAITGTNITNAGVGGAWTSQDRRLRLLGYI